MTDEELRAIAKAMDRAVERRAVPIDERLDEMQAALDEYAQRLRKAERLLGIQRNDMPNIAYDGLASGDDGVVWDDFEYDQRVPPWTEPRMVDRFKRP